MTIRIADLMQNSGVKFGTSGARGLVTAMTDLVCYAYTAAFLQHLEQHGRAHPGMRVAIAGDRRTSTGRIIRAVSRAATDRGYPVTSCGRIPSPAVALHGLQEQIPAIMVTGSHIPDDRNGIKFNAPEGEILKDDEASMRTQIVELADRFDEAGMFRDESTVPEPTVDFRAGRSYVARFVDAFPADLLKGKRLGLYTHSAVGRDLMQEIYEALGADVTRLADSDAFIPVDTEAIRPEDIALAATWAKEYAFDAIVSTDGDSDRPLLADELGRWMRGDVAGILCAKQLGADAVVTPVSCNSAAESCGAFARVIRTRIGSPYVVAAMQEAVKSGARRVVGYEANGGFLTASSIPTPKGMLEPLPTRDAVLVHLAVLWASVQAHRSLSQLLEELPPRFTWSDRIKEFPTELSHGRLAELRKGGESTISNAFGVFGALLSVDWTDGMRMRFEGDAIVHIRPSGNAPELRCYTEAATESAARDLNARAMDLLNSWR
jgi:phosphomannomutase